jgi:hypothetical protein
MRDRVAFRTPMTASPAPSVSAPPHERLSDEQQREFYREHGPEGIGLDLGEQQTETRTTLDYFAQHLD